MAGRARLNGAAFAPPCEFLALLANGRTHKCHQRATLMFGEFGLCGRHARLVQRDGRAPGELHSLPLLGYGVTI